MRFLIETGREQHTRSWQKCQAQFVGGTMDGKYLYENKTNIVSQEWSDPIPNAKVCKTVYELPEGTKILIDYNSDQGPIKKVIVLDSEQEVQEEEIGRGRNRSYSMKGRYRIDRDIIAERETAKKKSQEEGF